MRWTEEMEARLRNLCMASSKYKALKKDKPVDFDHQDVEVTPEKPEPKSCPWLKSLCIKGRCALWVKYTDPEDSCCAMVALIDNLVRGGVK